MDVVRVKLWGGGREAPKFFFAPPPPTAPIAPGGIFIEGGGAKKEKNQNFPTYSLNAKPHYTTPPLLSAWPF